MKLQESTLLHRRIARCRWLAAGLTVALLSSCATNEMNVSVDYSGGSDVELHGTVQGAGASSMKRAQELWIANFAGVQPGVTINYQDSGSGAGRDSFLSGGAAFAGSDRAFKTDENVAGSFAGCADDAYALDLPIYISPIAMIFNLEGVDSLDLPPDVLAGIFKGSITRWNDPAIAAKNPSAKLPDLAITVVHRSDKSGTTENLTDWLAAAAPSIWTGGASQEWNGVGGDAAEGTSGVLSTVKGANGTIGYADLAQAKDVSLISVNGVEPNPTDAATAVAASPFEEGRQPGDLALDLDRTAEGYPVVLVSYAIACSKYANPNIGAIIKEYLGYVASREGQDATAAEVGTAPLTDDLRERVRSSIDTIT